MADFSLGMNAKLYQAASTADPSTLDPATMTEMDNVTNVNLSMEANEANTTTRANKGWESTSPTLRRATLEFEMVFKTGDVQCQAIRSAYLSNGTVAFAALTGPHDESGNEGPIGNWSITNFTRNEDLEEAIKYNVTAKLSTFGSWHEVA